MLSNPRPVLMAQRIPGEYLPPVHTGTEEADSGVRGEVEATEQMSSAVRHGKGR